MFASDLQKAIRVGIENGDISSELSRFDDYRVSSKKDAQAICLGLRSIPVQKKDEDPYDDVYPLAVLFQNLKSQKSPAYSVLVEEGVPELVRLYDEILALNDKERNSDLLFLLKLFALYGTRTGAQRIIGAARSSLDYDSYAWHYTFGTFPHNRKQCEFVLQNLSDPIPKGFIGISMLDCANEAAEKGELKKHPFDSRAGVKRLQSLIQNPDPEKVSYATSAISALPYVRKPASEQLLAIAMKHKEGKIRIDSAFIAAKGGLESGLRYLRKMCLDVNYSDFARGYLHEIDREDLIPKEANDHHFLAKADFARWLMHENELGKAADELEILDHRKLAWPPANKQVPVWLIRYRLRDPYGLEKDHVDIGMVGTTTWCFFSYDLIQRPPEDCYAIHCYGELERKELVDEVFLTPSKIAPVLAGWPGKKMTSPNVELIQKVSRKLKMFPRPVVIASAVIEGEEGWAVIDGSASQWYPAAEQPEGSSEYEIAMIHIGRRLLGFEGQPDRKHWLTQSVPTEPEAREFLATYNQLLSEIKGAPAYRQNALIGKYGVLKTNFDRYVQALCETNGMKSSSNLVVAYERLLKCSLRVDESIRTESIDSYTFGLYGQKFEDYVEEKLAQGKQDDVLHVIAKVEPYWRQEDEFATVAFKVGAVDTAEKILSEISREKDFYRFETMGLLAEIWNNRGDEKQSRKLLEDCLRKLKSEFESAEYKSDREFFGEKFQSHRASYLRLFSGGATELAAAGIPVSLD